MAAPANVLPSKHRALALVSLLAGLITLIIPSGFETGRNWVIHQWRFFHHNKTWQCEVPDYRPHIITYDPFVMHIENFITSKERSYLLKLSKPLLQPSKVLNKDGTLSLHASRTSNTAFIPRDDPVGQCIMGRAADLQGFISPERFEDLQITAYNKSQQYKPHYDWWGNHLLFEQGFTNRISTFFVVLEAECENCGTRFPNLPTNWTQKDPRWCDFVECENTEALTVKAVPGAAIFWKNLDSEGQGDVRTLHQGLQVLEGHKTGMNIWTRIPVSARVV